jgi:hypothetical protein
MIDQALRVFKLALNHHIRRSGDMKREKPISFQRSRNWPGRCVPLQMRLPMLPHATAADRHRPTAIGMS